MEFEANGIRIHAEVKGSGPWLVLSHSLACCTAMWREQIDRFSERYRVLAFDTRGHLYEALGKTDAAIADLRHALKLDPANPLAHITREALQRLGAKR